MIEVWGDLWDATIADITAVTTNGMVRRDGACVMGRGTARQATGRFPGVEYELGALIDRFGNKPFLLQQGKLLSFPVKHHWRDAADLSLIEESAYRIVALADLYGWTTVATPRPGCGNGGLKWSKVEVLLGPIFDDRFVIVEQKVPVSGRRSLP